MNLRQQLAADLARKISGSVVGLESGHGCLMTDDRIFAFTRPDESAALKLPEARIAELTADDEIRHLIMGKRTMREWVIVEDPLAASTLKLLRASLAYVETLPKTAPKKKKK